MSSKTASLNISLFNKYRQLFKLVRKLSFLQAIQQRGKKYNRFLLVLESHKLKLKLSSLLV